MIFSEEGPVRVDKLEQLEMLSESHWESLRKADLNSKINLHIPARLKSNKEKSIYKIGFLSEFLKRLYPEEPYRKIIEIMNIRYQIFLGQRQVERNVKEYLENDIYR